MTTISATPANSGTLPITEAQQKAQDEARAYLAELQQQGLEKTSEYLDSPRAPSHIVAIGCADSRFVAGYVLNDPGIKYYRDVGGTLESDKPGHENELNEEAKAFFDALIENRDIEIVAYFPHGKCGCVHNACACAEEKAKKAAGHGHDAHDAHAHGGAFEGEILAGMGARKEYAVNLVKDPAKYLTEMGFDISRAADAADLKDWAIEIAHGLHQQKIAQDYLKSKGSKIKVVAPFYDIRTNENYLFVEGRGPNKQGQFIKATAENIEGLPETYKELGEKLLAGAKATEEVWAKNNLAKGQSPKVAAVGYALAPVSTDMLLNAKPGEVFTLSNATGLQNSRGKLSTQGKEFLTYAAHLGVESLVIQAGRPRQDKQEYAAKGNAAEVYLTKLGLPVSGLSSYKVHDRANDIAHALKDLEIAQAHLKKLYDEKPDPKTPINVVVTYFDKATRKQYQFDPTKNRFEVMPERKPEPTKAPRPTGMKYGSSGPSRPPRRPSGPDRHP